MLTQLVKQQKHFLQFKLHYTLKAKVTLQRYNVKNYSFIKLQTRYMTLQSL